MPDVDDLVSRYVREADSIASAAQATPGADLSSRIVDWVRAVREQADALPAGQGPALLIRIAGQLTVKGATVPIGEDQRGRTLFLLASRLSGDAP
ncbi:hypothetical protein [Methylobacterium nodulans]|uniref:Uncharacterized protein n=1 Tax=Methylobacterium nodulans (strain LMG 21967 / CNCM I-2342 / ORS 2060) TaxID=460265 RepID=B8IVA7_METNO|nr:hypothetical protein [Methylobacterium nodulans]ACL60958.1 hypothetical protein Mnod_6138 [Methylobacterium nodulans ORS 2060]